MTLASALGSSISGIRAQGIGVAAISDNIANSSTSGGKSVGISFSNLVGTGNAAGGVQAVQRRNITTQGLIQSTGKSTDIAINGNGLFVVNTASNSSSGDGGVFYTRNGDFDTDSEGFLKNSSGYYLQAWKLDSEGRLPGQPGNLNTTSFALQESLETVSINAISGAAAASTTASISANLDASQAITKGAGFRGEILAGDAENANLAADQIIIPNGTNNFSVGTDNLVVTTGGGVTHTFTYGGFDTTVALPYLGATTPTDIMTGATDGQSFTISTQVGNTSQTFTFTFQTSSPNPDLGTFNSLTTLANAINVQNGLTAKIGADNLLYYGNEDANLSTTVADVTGTIAATAGIGNIAGGTDRFHSLQSLATSVNKKPEITATIFDSTSDAEIEINVVSPLETIQFTSAAGNRFNAELTNVTNAAQTLPTTAINQVYDPTGSAGNNMTSGIISADFERTFQVFDSLGSPHDLRMAFLKSAANTWQVEIFAVNDNDIVTVTGPTKNQIATGTVTFNGDGTLRSVSNTLTSVQTINWLNGASESKITFNFGTAGQIAGTVGAATVGQTDGLSQFDGPYNVRFLKANGAATGNLRSVNFTEDGFLIANFSNGQSLKIYKVPIADFTNKNGLTAISGNAFSESGESGGFNLKEAGQGGVGKVVAASLESGSSEIADELTKIIVVQSAYKANTRVITTADELLEEVTRI